MTPPNKDRKKVGKVKVGIGGKKVGGRKGKGANPRVLGVKSDISDITLAGKRLKAKVGDAVLDATLDRTIEGASEVKLTLHDPERRLLQMSEFNTRQNVKLDGLKFRMTGMSKAGPDLDCTFEDWPVSKLREKTGPVKAYRDEVTRAEFILSLVRDALGKKWPVHIPELHVVQPIASSKELKDATKKRNDTGEEQTQGVNGLGPADRAHVKIKNVTASMAQLRRIDEALDTCMSMRASKRVMIATVMCGTQESNWEILNLGPTLGYGVYCQLDNGAWPEPESGGDVSKDTGPPNGFAAVAMKNDKENPGMALHDLVQSVQNSGAGASYYAQWTEESTRTVERYLGNARAGEGGEVSTEVTTTKRYAFQVGKNETYWAAIQRLAEEVKWRAFFVAGIFYYVSETKLFSGQVRMEIDEDSPGIDWIDFDYHMNKKVTEVTVTGRAKKWAAPPGTVVNIKGMGPASDQRVKRSKKKAKVVQTKKQRKEFGKMKAFASWEENIPPDEQVGRYIVTSISSSLLSSDEVSITLKKPTRPLPEPAPETETKTVTSGSNASGEASGDAAKLIKWAEKQVGDAPEGGWRHREYAGKLGYSTDLPWCGIFLGYGMKFICGIDPPGNPAYSGDWLNWGKRVSTSNPEPGDIVVYDWGDGGITDHVAIYIGGGERIGGNESDNVSKGPADLGSAVGIVRPPWGDD